MGARSGRRHLRRERGVPRGLPPRSRGRAACGALVAGAGWGGGRVIRETIEEVRASGGGRLVRHTGDRVSPTFMNALPPRYGFERTEVLAFELNDPRPRLPRLDVPTALLCAALVRDEAGIRKAHAVESRILLPNAPALWNRRYIPTCAASRALYAISLARKVTLPRAAGPEPDHRHGPPHGVAVGRAFNQCKPLPKAHTMP